MGDAHELGRRGEALAASTLEAAGWAVLARNFRVHRKEVDLVVRKGQVVAFVEVKTRAGQAFGHPLDAVTRAKRGEIERVARAWIARNGQQGDSYRFDVVAIEWRRGGEPVIEHVADAWRLG